MAGVSILEVAKNPKYQELVKKRSRFSWTLTLIMLAVYYGYIFLVAFNREYLAQIVSGSSVITLSIPIGLGVILFTVLITGVYVYRANSEFDRLTHEIVEESKK